MLEQAGLLKDIPNRPFMSRQKHLIALPLAKPGFITAAILGFAHTVGEFGVVLMIGGNIPGVTRVVSVQLYDHVEALDYGQAHWLSGALLLFSFVVLFSLYTFNRRASSSVGPRV